MSKVLVDREEIEAVRNTLANGGGAVGVLRWAESVLAAQPAEAEGVDIIGYMDGDYVLATDYEREVRCAIAAGIRMQDKCAALEVERDRLRDQVKVLQSDANSWQSGYDKGRRDGTKHRQSEVDQLRAEVEALRKDAAAGTVVWEFIDRMADPAECDPAENILNEFVAALDAAMAAKEA
ncbi:hypothetical protein OS670_19895 [Pseudomonadaceae bacterium T75]|nr:hypothetical protein OS670_19895 [Pseudomonadaceae bacterium T75]